MIETIIFMSVGSFLIVVAIIRLNKFKQISKDGTEVEGIIFDSELSTSTGTSSSYPIVRFLTKESDWITQKSSVGTIPGLYKQGDKIKIIYKVNEPNKFYIKDVKTSMVPVILIIVGSVQIILGIFKLIGMV